MVVVAVGVSSPPLSIDPIYRSPCTATSSFLKSQQQHTLFSSSCSLNAPSASASLFHRYLTSSSSSNSSSPTVSAIRSPRTITIGGAARKTSTVSIAGVTHGSPGADAHLSWLAIGSHSAAFVSGSINAWSVHAAIAETAGDGLKWWERGGAPNILDVHTTEEFVEALSAAGDKLVIVEFYATWCGSCRALYPKFCKIAAEYRDVNFLKVNFDENKSMCKSLNVKVLPFFHIYRGAEGRLDSFSCSLSKLQRLKDAIAKHHDGPCEDCPPPELLGDAFKSLLEKTSADQSATAGGSSD